MLYNDKIKYNSSVIYNSSDDLREKYRLQWLQSISTIAGSQDIFVRSSNKLYIISSEMDMTKFFTEYDFLSESLVEWWVRTYDSKRILFADSEHNTFTAS